MIYYTCVYTSNNTTTSTSLITVGLQVLMWLTGAAPLKMAEGAECGRRRQWGQCGGQAS